jgi:hypothetical protein
MSYNDENSLGFSGTIIIGVILLAFFITLNISCSYSMGTHGFGPENTYTITVTKTYVDHSGSGDSSKSHYMVSTDQGVFEVNNSIINGIYNADEIFGQIKEGKKYEIVAKGRKVTNMFFQQYPYIIKLTPLD